MSSEMVSEYEVLHARPKAFFDRFTRKEELQHQTHYCPGCGHGQVHKMLARAIDELGIQDRTILIGPVGCGGLYLQLLRRGQYFGRARTRAGGGHGGEAQQAGEHRHRLSGRW